MFVDEKHVMLEASIEMRLQTKVDNDWVVVAVYMGVDTIESFEQLPDQGRECFGKWYTLCYASQ